MSGRLVILRHKSWHVWNQDNQEKVLRDERLHRESEEAKRAEGKRKLSETIYSTLSSGESLTQFVEVAEPPSTQTRGEKGESSQPPTKRDPALDDWKLGDGSRELSKVAPWYEHGSTTRSASHYDEQDAKRKKLEDPMAAFCADKSHIESKTAEEDSFTEKPPPLMVETPPLAVVKNDGGSTSSSDNDSRGRKSKSRKDRSKDKSKKDKRRKDKKKDKKNRRRSPSPVRAAPMVPDGIDFDALRARRLEREKSERKREQLLLAEVDIFGTHSSDRFR